MKHITIDALQDALQIGTEAHIIDVRTPEEYNEGHIKGAKNIPLDTIPASVDSFNDEDEYIIICKRGGRALQAAEYLDNENLNITVVDQGMDDWQVKSQNKMTEACASVILFCTVDIHPYIFNIHSRSHFTRKLCRIHCKVLRWYIIRDFICKEFHCFLHNDDRHPFTCTAVICVIISSALRIRSNGLPSQFSKR